VTAPYRLLTPRTETAAGLLVSMPETLFPARWAAPVSAILTYP
jgi:hypothetical protein